MRGSQLTNAAVLLFGKDVQDFFLQAELKAVRFKGTDVTGPMIDFKTIDGDAITLHEKAENFIFDHIPRRAWLEPRKLQRQEKWLYPPDAIREALANALMHRDYASTGKVQVRIFDDRLEIWNPGHLIPPLTIEKLKGEHDSILRNPLMAKAFFWIRFAEDMGSGTSKIVEWCRKWKLPEPAYKEAGGSFVIVFHNPEPGSEFPEGPSEGSVEIREKTREKTREKILRVIRENPQATIHDLSEAVGLTNKAIEWNIKKLKNEKLLQRVGPDKGGHWKVI